MSLFVARLADGMTNGFVYALLALALVVVFRGTGTINFAQGEIALFTTYIAWWLGTVSVMFVALALMHHFLPDRKRQWRWFTPGNIFAVTAVLISSAAFNLFFRYSPTVPKVYTVLAGFVILMTWIYVAILMILIGTEIDTAIQTLHQTDNTPV